MGSGSPQPLENTLQEGQSNTPASFGAFANRLVPWLLHQKHKTECASLLCLQAVNAGEGGTSSLLPVSGHFFIPGQRFRELYYWDTYWVVRGLIVSGMLDSAKVGD